MIFARHLVAFQNDAMHSKLTSFTTSCGEILKKHNIQLQLDIFICKIIELLRGGEIGDLLNLNLPLKLNNLISQLRYLGFLLRSLTTQSGQLLLRLVAMKPCQFKATVICPPCNC